MPRENTVTTAPDTSWMLTDVERSAGLEIAWNAVRAADDRSAPRDVRFVIAIRPLGRITGCWMRGSRTDADRRAVMTHEPVACDVLRDGDLFHLDARGAGAGPLLAVSLLGPDDASETARLVFARTPLLAAAGLHPGGYDPPCTGGRRGCRTRRRIRLTAVAPLSSAA